MHGEIRQAGVSYYPGTAVRVIAPDSVPVAEERTTSSELPPVLPWSDIRRIDKLGHATGRGALIGGGVSLALALVSIASNDCSGEGAAEVCTVAGGASILAIPVGTGIGALIGAASHRWKTVYRRP